MDNPLKQYFRRPSLYLKLPSGGKFYKEGAIDLPENKEIPIYPMTAIDEITAKTPDALYNGTAVVEIIKSCAPNIKDPWSIPTMDLDPLLIAIRAATNGNELEVESTCPNCSEQGKYGVNLIGLLNGLSPGNYDDIIEINDLKFKFSPLNYNKINQMNLGQFELSQMITNIENITDEQQRAKASSDTIKHLNDLTITMVAESIDYVMTPVSVVNEKQYIVDFLKNCDKNTFDELKSTTIKLREGSQLKPLKVTCVSCSNKYEQALSINVSDFFD